MSLTIMLVAEDATRARAALSLALAQAALGQDVQVYAHERAVALLADTLRSDDDSAALAAAGLPDRRAMLRMAIESGVALIACQTGLAMTGMTADDLIAGASTGGLVGILAASAPQNLVVI
ncbi:MULTISPECIES: DsrE family protein [Sphingomonas]|uniref:DsrE family protein n=1 Tax=Sphingomonas TaxID=13687 RepID=UPI00082FA4C8|nr:DsrE family protein [Sphingomonas sp. CCH10-B3]